MNRDEIDYIAFIVTTDGGCWCDRYKHTRLAHLLQQNDRPDLTTEEKRIVIEDLVREITALWQTDELRRRKPTPLDGALSQVINS